MVELSAGEQAAERLFNGACSRKLTFREFVALAKHLERWSPEGAAYLRFLHARFVVPDVWPPVG